MYFIFALSLLSLLIAFGAFVYYLYRVAVTFVGQIFLYSRKSRLMGLPFVHYLVFGYGYKYAGERSFFSDGDIAIVVGLNGTPSGVIGIKPGRNCLEVYQLQGIERGNFVGAVSAGDYLLTCAEKIADALGKKYVKLMPASENFYYGFRKDSESLQDQARRQGRLRRMYDVTAKQRGYARGDKGWWIKQL
jgi:hypothetical protein